MKTISVIQPDKEEGCYICGRKSGLEEHHIFGGANRGKSEADGMKVWLCYECHRTGKMAVHTNKRTMDWLHTVGQTEWEKRYGSREKFVERYGKSYL